MQMMQQAQGNAYRGNGNIRMLQGQGQALMDPNMMIGQGQAQYVSNPYSNNMAMPHQIMMQGQSNFAPQGFRGERRMVKDYNLVERKRLRKRS